MAQIQQLLEQARQLPPEDRAQLARAILASLDEEEDGAVVDEAWSAEIQRRIAEVRGGEIELEEGDAIHARVRKRLGGIQR